MRPIGFSTGALAYSDFRRGLQILLDAGIKVVELSALREGELLPLLSALHSLNLSRFDYISVHAPSRFPPEREPEFAKALIEIGERGWPVILHPDAIKDPMQWRPLGAGLCIENMDKRKPIGRSATEMNRIYGRLPDASFCFDIGHARQFDSTMTEAYLLLTAFAGKLRQVHVSEVNTSSRHDVISYGSMLAFRKVAHLIPQDIPLILETPTAPEGVHAEMTRVLEALPVSIGNAAAYLGA